MDTMVVDEEEPKYFFWLYGTWGRRQSEASALIEHQEIDSNTETEDVLE